MKNHYLVRSQQELARMQDLLYRIERYSPEIANKERFVFEQFQKNQNLLEGRGADLGNPILLVGAAVVGAAALGWASFLHWVNLGNRNKELEIAEKALEKGADPNDVLDSLDKSLFKIKFPKVPVAALAALAAGYYFLVKK